MSHGGASDPKAFIAGLPLQTASLRAPRSAMARQIEALARTPNATGRYGFAELLSLVAGESNFKPHAHNRITGAAGPFQFVKSTWLSLLRKHGAAMGVPAELTEQIVENARGRPTIADPVLLQKALALRDDLALSAKAAALYLDDNKVQMTHALHRMPTDPELRLSFLLGAHGAVRLIHAAERTPEIAAAEVLPHAATANHHLFFSHDGKPRSAMATVAFLAAKFHRDAAKCAAYARVQSGNV